MSAPTTPQDRKAKADPRGVQRLKIGGKSRLLRFDANAIIEACDATGMDDLESILNAAAALNVRMLRALTWAGLLHEEEDLELREVGSWIGDGKGLTSVSDVLVACIGAVNTAIGVDPEETEAAIATADPTRRGGTGAKRSAPRSQPGSATPSSGD
jgi:hypothetical protein